MHICVRICLGGLGVGECVCKSTSVSNLVWVYVHGQGACKGMYG